MNDEVFFELLVGVIYDIEIYEWVLILEVSWRLGLVWKISLDVMFFYSLFLFFFEEVNNGFFDFIYKFVSSSYSDLV